MCFLLLTLTAVPIFPRSYNGSVFYTLPEFGFGP